MAPAPAPSGALPTQQVNGLPVPTFYPDGGQVGPETKLYLTLRENRGFRILYTLDYGRPQPGGEAGVSTTHEYTKPVHMRMLGGGESLIRAVCISEDGTLGDEVARAFHVTHDYDDGGLSDDGAALLQQQQQQQQQQQHPARSGWTTAPSPAEEDAAALYERRSVSPASTPPPSYLPQQRRAGEGGMPPSPTPSNHSSQGGGSKVKSLAYPPREPSLDRAPECGAGNPAASINVGRSPSASPGSDVRSISARLSGRYSAQPTPEQSPDRSARCRSSSGPTQQQQQQQQHSNAVTDLAGLVVPPPAWLTAKASAAAAGGGLPPSPQHAQQPQAPPQQPPQHPHTSPEYYPLDGELLVGKTSSGGSAVRSGTPPVEPAGSGGFAKRPPSEYRQPPAAHGGEPAPAGGVEVTSLDYLTHMVHSMDAQAAAASSSHLTVAAVASASSGGGGGGGVTNSSQRSGTVTSIDEVAVGSGGGGGGERKPAFAKSADAILGGSDEAGGVDAMGEALHVCDRCGRSWMLKDRMLKHKEFCSGPSRPSKSRSPSRKVTWGGGGGGGGGSSSSFGGRDRRSSTGDVGVGRKGRSGSFSDCNSGLNGNESFYSRSSVGSNSCYSAATYSHTNRTEAQPHAAAAPRRSVGAHNSSSSNNINNPSSNSLAGSNINTSFGSSQSRTSTSADTGPAPSQSLRPDQAKHKFSSPPASTHSSVAPSRLSTTYTAGGASREGGYGGYRKPNIKSPSRQPLAVPKGLHNCPHCSRAMKEAALDSHIKRCTEEPANKKRLEVEGENRRRMRESKQNGGSANAAQDGGAVGNAAHYPSVVGAGRFSASPADRRFGASKSLTPVLKPTSPPMAAHEMFGRTATLITHTHSPGAPANYRATAAAQQRDSASETASIASSQRPIKPSPLLQDRRNAWKRARAQSGMSASR